MKPYVAGGRIVNGVLHVRNTRLMEKFCAEQRDCEITLTLEKAHARRSKRQNDYYWSVVVARCVGQFRRLGLIAGEDPKLTHEILKCQFTDIRLVEEGFISGYIHNGLVIGSTTTGLTTLWFIEYCDRIVDHAAAYWEIYIPPPDPEWRQHAEEVFAAELAAAEEMRDRARRARTTEDEEGVA